MICAGIDAGSRAIKIVLLDADSGKIIAQAVADQGVDQKKLTSELFEKLLAENRISKSNIGPVIATGYGRGAVDFADSTITEISCHAVGVRRLMPDAMTVIDIGGQDSKLIRMDKNGKVRDFAMNDRCAAGTGRFLEVVAERLEVDLNRLGQIADKSTSPARISSMCVVFAETEIIGLLAAGQAKENIVAGVQSALAERIRSMAQKTIEPPVVFTGGVALIRGMDRALAAVLGQEIRICPRPQMSGALGAAILAANNTD
jgi:predicted CoA-substrate-specific enzyme activase